MKRSFFVLSASTLCLIAFFIPSIGETAEFNSIPLPEPPAGIPALNPDSITQGLPGPFGDFLNSVKQINQGITQESTKINLRNINPTHFFQNVNGWVQNITGLNIKEIIRDIGNLVAWFLSWVANLIRWGLSFIR